MRFTPQAALLTTLLFVGCGDKPIEAKPTRGEIVGVWECKELPERFGKLAGIDSKRHVSRLVVREDGQCIATGIPLRDPCRVVDLATAWVLTDPSMTPSGHWSLDLDCNFFEIRSTGKSLVLRQTIDASERFSATYHKAEQAADGKTPQTPQPPH